MSPPPLPGHSPSTAALATGAGPSAAASKFGAPFPQVRVSVATLARVVLSPPVTTALFRLAVIALVLGLFVSRDSSSPASGCRRY